MLIYNYAKELDSKKIFDINKKEDIPLFKKAVDDCKKIEEHFSFLPNIDIIKPYIILSFLFDKELNYKDRINYIIGIIYSRKYIDESDIKYLLNKVIEDIDPNDTKSFFFNKGFYENREGFFTDLFYEELTAINELLEKTDSLIKLNNESENGNISKELIDNNVTTAISDVVQEELNQELNDTDEYNSYLECYYEVSSREKVELFKDNFEKFIDIYLDSKNVEKRKNNRKRKYIIKGMRDWYNYVISIMEDIIDINEKEKLTKSLDLSKFL